MSEKLTLEDYSLVAEWDYEKNGNTFEEKECYYEKNDDNYNVNLGSKYGICSM